MDKEQRILSELIGKVFPIKTFEQDLADFFYEKKRCKKLWYSNLPCEIKAVDGSFHQVNFRCNIERPSENYMYCLVLKHEGNQVHITEGYLELI